MFDPIHLIFFGCQRWLSHWGDSVWFLGHNSTPKFNFLLCSLGGCLGSSCLHPTVPGSQTHAADDTHQWATNEQIHDITQTFHSPLGSVRLFSIRGLTGHISKMVLCLSFMMMMMTVKPVHTFTCKVGRDNANAHIFNWSFSCLNQVNHSEVLCSSHSIAIKSCFDHFTCYQCKFCKF